MREVLPPESPIAPFLHEPEGGPPSQGSRPNVSFLVCTRNRVDRLKACVRSIERACRRHADLTAELIVVDNGSTDGTSQWLARIAPTTCITTILVSQPRPGLAAARNAALENASGRILVFVDDDCEIHPDYLRDLGRHYANGEQCAIRGGRVELGHPEDLPFTIKRSPLRALFTRDVHPGGFVLGCNMTMPREVADRVGPFDEWFGAGGPLRSAEDTDYLIRAFLLGIPIEYVPDMTVFHHHGRRSRPAVDELHRNYSLGNGGLCVKHIRHAPWLLLHFCWTLRSAWRELWGGSPFDDELRLSHWPIVFMNLVGAFRFVTLRLRRPGHLQARQVERTTASCKMR